MGFIFLFISEMGILYLLYCLTVHARRITAFVIFSTSWYDLWLPSEHILTLKQQNKSLFSDSQYDIYDRSQNYMT